MIIIRALLPVTPGQKKTHKYPFHRKKGIK